MRKSRTWTYGCDGMKVNHLLCAEQCLWIVKDTSNDDGVRGWRDYSSSSFCTWDSTVITCSIQDFITVTAGLGDIRTASRTSRSWDVGEAERHVKKMRKSH